MKKPGDVTKIVLKKSTKHIIIKTIVSILYRGIAMLTPILFSKAVDLVTAGDYINAIYISIGAIVLVITFRMFGIVSFEDNKKKCRKTSDCIQLREYFCIEITVDSK